jgi:hypothetical protein
VRLECPSAAVVGESEGQRVSIQSAVTAVADGAWHDYSIDLADFLQPEFQAWERIDATRCRSRVDTIGFELTADSLAETPGRHMAGTVEFDDIELRAFEAPDDPALALAQHSPWRCWSSPIGSNLPEARPDPQACELGEHAPRMSFDEDYRGEEEPWKALCSVPVTTNNLSHESTSDGENLTRFKNFSFTAQFTPGELAPEAPGRFTVRLSCTSLFPDQAPSAVLDVDVRPGRFSYALPLASFRPSPYPIGFVDVAACLAKVDELCFETQLELGEAISGALVIDDVVLR